MTAPLSRAHLGIPTVLRDHPDATTNQMKRVTRTRQAEVAAKLDDLHRAGLATVQEEPQRNGTTLKRWRAA